MLESALQTQRAVISKRYRAGEWKRYTDIKIEETERNSNIKRETQRCQVGYLMCVGFFHGLFIPSTWVWCNMTVRSSPITLSFFPSLAIPRDLWTSIAQLSLLWWKIISDWSRPLALLQWPVKYSSINHLWLLKEPDSWPPEIVGLHLRGDEGVWIKGGKGIRGSSLPYSETMLYFPGNTLSLTRSPGHVFPAPFIHFHYKKLPSRQRGLMPG